MGPGSSEPILLPANLQEARFWGEEPGGAQRAVVAGVRILMRPDGTLAAAANRLPASPSSVVRIPERLGGGFVYVLGSQLWRSQTWLGESGPIFATPAAIDCAFVGLDRLYVRFSPGSLAALDPRSGRLRELGPLPSAPHFGQLVALDAWRALAVADLRGALVTADAGASWHPVALAREPSHVVALKDVFGITTLDADRHEQWWLVRANGRSEPLADRPLELASNEATEVSEPVGERKATVRPLFDQHPLAAAIEDGWPLRDGTALIARDGMLARVRISDGGLVDLTAEAFPLAPAKCHAVALSRPVDIGGFGFVCGEPRGKTVIYAWDPLAAALVELRRFEDAREVLAPGNGLLAVRGGCSFRREWDSDQEHHSARLETWCAMSATRRWAEVRLRVDREGVQPVVLSDGRVAWLQPPSGGDLATARLTFGTLDGDRPVVDVPLRFGPLDRETAHVLRLGTWMHGFEERRPGVLGGWVDAGGSVLGIEIDAHGDVRSGEYIRDAGAPVVSGRWAFGWTASRGGFESIDGGMTWTKELPLPDPVAEPRARTERVCGPIGCITAGWLRIGWGGHDRPAPVVPRSFRALPAWSTSRTLRLECEPPAPGIAAKGGGSEPIAFPQATSRAAASTTAGSTPSPGNGGWSSPSSLPSFSGRVSPPVPPSDLSLTAEGSIGLERSMRFTPAARVYAWGPETGEWNTLGRWQVRWDWPWGGSTDSRASAIVGSPWPTLDAARRALTTGAGPPPTVWSVVAGDDPDHALLVARHGSTAELVVLEAERAPVPAQHDGDDSFPEPQSARYVGGRWFVATSQAEAEPSATVLWTLDGPVAHELIRIPRAGFDLHPEARLARRTDARAIGVLVEGQPDLTQPMALWLAPVDLESGAAGEPVSIGPPGIIDRSGRICTGDEAADVGWDLDLPFPGVIELSRDEHWHAPLQSAMVRLHVSRDASCIERILGSVDPYGAAPPLALTAPSHGVPRPRLAAGSEAAAAAAPVEVSVFSARMRFPLRCWER